MPDILYGRVTSINVQKVLWLLHELDLPCERVDAGGTFGFPGGFAALTPAMRIPVLQWAGGAAWESNTILRLIATRAGAGALYPEEPGARAGVEAWMDWQLASLGTPVRRVFQKTVRGQGSYGPQDVAEMNAAMEVLAAGLSPGGNLLGAGLTLADIALAPFAHRWLELAVDKPDLPALRDWRERLRAREGFTRHVDHPLV